MIVILIFLFIMVIEVIVLMIVLSDGILENSFDGIDKKFIKYYLYSIRRNIYKCMNDIFWYKLEYKIILC